jgi:radical SAM protein with 4Fe4S-binding SPASM domain
MYLLNSNVFVAFGAKKSLIYDLRNKYLSIIWLDEKETTILKNFLYQKDFNKNISSFIKKLINKQLLDLKKVKKVNTSLRNEIDFDLFNFTWIEITNKCNFSCIHCYGSFCPENFYELSLDDIELIIQNLKELKIRNIQIIGGEPFLIKREKLKKILNLFLEENFNIEIFTNGYFIDDNWATFFQKNNIKIAMSVYSHEENIHCNITHHPLSFKHLKRSIKILEKKNIPYRLAYVKTKYNNMSSLEDIKNTFSTTAPIKNDPIRLVGKASKNLLNETLKEERQLTLSYFKNIKIESSFIKRNIFRHNCFSYKFYIDSLLDVYPCVMERRIKYGNIKYEKLKEILEKNTKYINFSKDMVEECKLCEFRYCCFDCRPDNASDDFNAKVWYCTYNPTKGEWNENIK